MLQWGRDVSIPEMLRSDCVKVGPTSFNGAGMFLSRKSNQRMAENLHGNASMGPGCFYPGNGDSSGERSNWGYGFNGAGMFLSRK